MNINTITAEDLRRMPDKEGLILQGCGGDLTEWVDGINEMLTKAGILKDGCQFENVAAFQHGELTCLLYCIMWAWFMQVLQRTLYGVRWRTAHPETPQTFSV